MPCYKQQSPHPGVFEYKARKLRPTMGPVYSLTASKSTGTDYLSFPLERSIPPARWLVSDRYPSTAFVAATRQARDRSPGSTVMRAGRKMAARWGQCPLADGVTTRQDYKYPNVASFAPCRIVREPRSQASQAPRYRAVSPA